MYCEAKTYKRCKRKKRKKGRIFFAIFLSLVLFVVLYYFYVISPIICSLSEEKIKSLSTAIISQSVQQSLDDGDFGYDDFVHITYDSNGDILLIQSDTTQINRFVRRVTELVQLQMDRLGEQGIQIALGTFTGIPFLFGIGPMISLKLVPVGLVETNFVDDFESVGINQTKHTLNFLVTTKVGMILPAKTQNFSTTLEVAICESIIVGKIPQIYLNNLKNN